MLVIIWGHPGKLPTIMATVVVHAVHVKPGHHSQEVACQQAIAKLPIANVEPTRMRRALATLKDFRSAQAPPSQSFHR